MEIEMEEQDRKQKETAESVAKDPAGFWNNMHLQNMQETDKVIAEARKKLGAGLDFYLDHMKLIIEIQSRELAIFRVLETGIRSARVSEESIQEVMDRLTSLRVEVRSLGGEVAAAAKT